MGTFKKGINGPFSGKIGSVIGSHWKDVSYMKGLYRTKSNKKPSEDQLRQRDKFKLLLDFFAPIKRLLAIGFGQYVKSNTAVNAAMRFNYDMAFYEEEGKVLLDYSKIQFSRGSLFTAGAEKAMLTDRGIHITWNTKTYGISGHFDDIVHITCLTYIGKDRFFDSESGDIRRHHGEAIIELNTKLKPVEIHVWLFLSSQQGDKVSKTVYIPIEISDNKVTL